MQRTAILVAALLLLPVVAGAQGVSTSRTMTVNGSAENRVPATLARVTIALMSNDRQAIFNAQSIQPIVDALVKAGADPASVHVPLNLATSGNWSAASLSASFAQPTTAAVQNGIKSAEAVVAGMRDTTLSGVWLALTAANCREAQDAARSQATARAHAKALALASDLNVHLGEPLAVNAFDPIEGDGSCTAQYTVGQYSGGNSAGPLAADDFASVLVRSNISVTYAIK